VAYDGLYTAARALLRQALDDDGAEFREGQWEPIYHLVDERAHLLVVQRTGWGKSLVYFLATRLLRDRGAGLTLLISPLLALMRNQILSARRIGLRAETINSSNRGDWLRIQKAAREGEVDLLLISPERLANDDFRRQVLLPIAGRIGLFVVDEAHCISDWGHDFRPDYRRIVQLLRLLPPTMPVLATTATANDRVVADIVAQLGSSLLVLRGSLARDGLCLQNIELPNPAARLAWLAQNLPRLPGSGIIYTLTVRDAQGVAEWLRLHGIAAEAYWGDLEASRRAVIEEQLLDNAVKAVVATTALGMGFDKPDLGFVIHYQRPGSVIHYYQQVGRAGRAITRAHGILLAGAEDDEIAEYFLRTAFPPEAHVDEVLRSLEEASDGLTLSGLEAVTNLAHGQLTKVLKVLAVQVPSPVAQEGGRWYATAVRPVPDPQRVARLIAVRRAEQAAMRAYLQSRTCLMAFLRRELDDVMVAPCGQCAVCVGAPIVPTDFRAVLADQAVSFLRSTEHIIEPRRQWPSDAGAAHGWRGRISSDLRAGPGRALSQWGDSGWGDLVRRGKQHDGRFHDALVGALTGLVRSRWRPSPPPTWVTCVPSLTHPRLVPDPAERVARSLGVPFVPCVRKIRPTDPQKRMHNSYHQVRNLAAAFAIEPWPGLAGAVLLLDDLVDSGWTFTIVAALLRSAGSGPVYPLALARVITSTDE
jgi:ATP-dependent DNA helicase RecQ